MAEGDELPPVVIPLEGNDASFLEMLERDKAALSAFVDEMRGILGDGFSAVGETAAEELPAALAEAGQQAAAAFDEELTPEIEATIRELNAPIVESLAQAGADGGEAFAEGISAGVDSAQEELAGLDATVAEYQARISENLRLGQDEQAQAAMAELAEWRAAVDEATAGGATIAPAVTQALADVDAGAISAAEAVTRLEASEEQAGATATVSSREFEAMATALNTVGVSSGLTLEQLRAAAVTFEDAARVADEYGTSEAQLAISTQALTDAQGQLVEQAANLIQVYGTMSAAGTESLSALQVALQDLADAEATVTAQAVAQVEALNAVNLAVIENETALMNDAVAFRGLESASIATGIELSDLTQQLEEGSFAALNQAAANAQAGIKADLLTGAQQKLAAANLTLVDTWRQLAEGADVSAAAQRAALDSVAKAQSEVSALSGGGAGAAASESGSLMSGPAGMLLWNLPFMLPMITQMFGNSGQAAQQYEQQLQSLGSTIAQDGGQIGANTEAALANQIAYSSLSDSLAHYGVSLTQAVQYASGVTAVQQQVTASLNDQSTAAQIAAQFAQASRPAGTVGTTVEGIQAQQIQDAQHSLEALAAASQKAVEKQNEVSAATLATEKVTGVYTGQVKAAELAMDQQAETANVNAAAMTNWLDTVVPGTEKYNQAINDQYVALKSQAQQADITAAAQREYLAELLPGTQAYTNAVHDQETALEMNARAADIAAKAQIQYLQTVVPGTLAYAQAMDVARASLLANADQSAITTIAQMNLGGATDQFQIQLSGILDEYQQTTAAASGYTSVLNAMDATTNNLLSSEAGFTIALNQVTTAVQQNGTSLDINTDKGALNIQTFTGVANAAQKAAEGVYQSEVQTKGATTAYNDANRTLEAEKQAFIDAADKAGFNKQAVKQLADELYQLPPDVKVNVEVNTKRAVDGMNALIYGIDSSTAYLNVIANTSGVQPNPHSGIKYNASGGPGFAGVPQVVGDGGRAELFVPDSNGYVFPSVDQGLAALAGAYGGGGGQGMTVVQVYLDGEPMTRGVRSTSRYYANRNSTTGFN
jgi:hypothetical protein